MRVLSESHPIIRRVVRFLLLPYCFLKLVPWKECGQPHWQVVKDFGYLFFVLKMYPDNYGPCRLWEKPREDWSYYYGSAYDPYQRSKLRHFMQPFKFQIVFNDKELWASFVSEMRIKSPKHLGVLDSRENYVDDLALLMKQHNVSKAIIKPVAGSGGSGIFLAARTSTGFAVRTPRKEILVSDWILKGRYIVQAVVEQHKDVSQISNQSLNTIRTLTMLGRDNSIMLVSASMRFGRGRSFIDNWSSGGLSVGVDCMSGKLMQYGYDKYGTRYTHHPDSGVKFDQTCIPFWKEVIQMSESIQQKCPFYRILGCDIAITESGPIVIEVNADPDFVYQEQTSGPLLLDKRVFEQFRELGLLFNKSQFALHQD